ncbi:protein FAM204A [Octopus sinensis]|uniref:Protein FAM204A n=1 Tax=Octopus sinensis TaxID=2607531 RepID=A0A6P7U4T7_9MOLL|nr:protein FAM204A [Octopus sinensis]
MEKPASVRTDLWEKFKRLEKKTDDLLNKHSKSKVKTSEDDKKEDGSEKLPDSSITSQKNVNSHEEKPSTDNEEIQNCKTSNSDVADCEHEWKDLKQYLDVNSHLQYNPVSTSAPKSGLEKQINEAIAKGDFETAETLSDRLAKREFAVKITGSFEAREYLKRKKDEEMTVKAKKKKKLHWGFEHKQRWEMKGNM